MSSSFTVIFQKKAVRDLKCLPREVQEDLLVEIKKYLIREPYRPIKTRLKKLHHFKVSLYRLRVGDYRVYYKIKFNEVVVLSVLHKKESERWLKSV